MGPFGAEMPRVQERPDGDKVNHMLATGASYAMVVRALGEDNAKLAKCDRVTIDSIRTHTTKHFPVHRPLTPRIGRSWSGGLGRTRSISSRGWPRHSRRSPTSRL